MMTVDKLYHFIAGFLISLIGGYFNPLCGLFLGIFAGVAKEVYDYYDYGLFDKKDMLFTWLGAIIGYLGVIMWLFRTLLVVFFIINVMV